MICSICPGRVAKTRSAKTTARIFVSHLAGKAVFDQDGDQVGRVRDVIVQFSAQQERPRVLGLVGEVTGKRRVFLPITRVTAIEIDPEQRFARVQPGIVLDALQKQLSIHQLIFAPDPSTHNR